MGESQPQELPELPLLLGSQEFLRPSNESFDNRLEFLRFEFGTWRKSFLSEFVEPNESLLFQAFPLPFSLRNEPVDAPNSPLRNVEAKCAGCSSSFFAGECGIPREFRRLQLDLNFMIGRIISDFYFYLEHAHASATITAFNCRRKCVTGY